MAAIIRRPIMSTCAHPNGRLPLAHTSHATLTAHRSPRCRSRPVRRHHAVPLPIGVLRTARPMSPLHQFMKLMLRFRHRPHDDERKYVYMMPPAACHAISDYTGRYARKSKISTKVRGFRCAAQDSVLRLFITALKTRYDIQFDDARSRQESCSSGYARRCRHYC